MREYINKAPKLKLFLDKIKLRKVDSFYLLPIIDNYQGGKSLYWLNSFLILKEKNPVITSIRFEVNVKYIGDKYYCFQTIKGYDYSFTDEGKGEEKALKQMAECIRNLHSSTGKLDVTLLLKEK